MSFRATLNAVTYTDRGFKVNVNRKDERVEIVFDSNMCDKSIHGEWLKNVEKEVGSDMDLPTALKRISQPTYLKSKEIIV